MLLDWAVQQRDTLEIHALLDGGCLIGYIGWAMRIDNVWEALFIRIRSDHQGKGLGRAMLARSTRDLLAADRVPLYELDARNQASLHIALAAGYHDFCHVHDYEGIP